MKNGTVSALDIRRTGAVTIIGFNRPETINAINDEIRFGLPAALNEADSDDDTRVIVLHGGDARGFCAGADIKEARPSETAIAAWRRHASNPWIESFARTNKPTIAAVHGYCMGGGMEIALACDIRIASPDAVFSLPETALGLIPGAGGTQRLHRIIGYGRALDLLLTGERIDATEAHRIGLVTRLAPDREALLDAAIALAETIARRAPAATLFAKEALRSGSDLPLGAGLALERNLFALLSATEDKIEAARAFKEKRAPIFTGN